MKILDCTLRDGGYYTNWDFDPSVVETYLKSLNKLPIDYLEVGYRSGPLDGYLGNYFYCPEHILMKIRETSSKKIAIMLNEKNVKPKDAYNLLNPVKDSIDMVRMAVNPKEFKRALLLAEEVKKMGFEVGFNVMYMSTWKEEKDFINQIKESNDIADYLYMVDSFGGVFPNEVKDIIELVRSKSNAKLGFHGHNNLEMALANTLVAIDEGVDMVDATITGMGRGAGNLKTELLLTVLNSRGMIDFQYNDLSKTVDSFTKLQEMHQWGTSLPYMFSGANSLPQSQVMEWVGKRYYSFNSILRGLSNQAKGQKDNRKLPQLNFETEKRHDKALLVGGGPSAVEHSDALKRHLISNPDAVVIHASSKNAMSFWNLENDQYFCLVGNEGHRLEDVFLDHKISGKCILPPYPRTMGTYIPKVMREKSYELKEVNFTNVYKDSHTALAIQSLIELGVKEVLVTGYDGYKGEISQKERDLFIENQRLFTIRLVN